MLEIFGRYEPNDASQTCRNSFVYHFDACAPTKIQNSENDEIVLSNFSHESALCVVGTDTHFQLEKCNDELL